MENIYKNKKHLPNQNKRIKIHIGISEMVRPLLVKLHTSDCHHEWVLLKDLPFPKWSQLPWKPQNFERY
jgi:hypothetical protein